MGADETNLQADTFNRRARTSKRLALLPRTVYLVLQHDVEGVDNGGEPEEDTTDDVNPKLGLDTDFEEHGQWGQEERCVLARDRRREIRKRTQNAPDNLFTIHGLVKRIKVEVFLFLTSGCPAVIAPPLLASYNAK